jgi:hypothetical protein
MPCTVVFIGGDKLTFDVEPAAMADLLAARYEDSNGFIQADRPNGPVYIKRERVLFIRPLDSGEVAPS